MAPRHRGRIIPHQFRRTVVGLRSLALALLLSAGASASGRGLTCIALPNQEEAAIEFVRGEHPLWADGALVGTLEAIDRAADPMVLTIRPTIVFSGQYPVVLELGMRSDGPPPERIFHVGSSYFVSVTAGGFDGPAQFVAPCAPNFEVAHQAQVQRLLEASPDADVRAAFQPAAQPQGPPLALLFALVGAGVVIGLSWVSFRARNGSAHG